MTHEPPGFLEIGILALKQPSEFQHATGIKMGSYNLVVERVASGGIVKMVTLWHRLAALCPVTLWASNCFLFE